MKFFSVITTIQPPTSCVLDLVKRIEEYDGYLIVAGDSKGPETFDVPRTKFLSIRAQEVSGFKIASKLPTKHYARKNIAYLEAIRSGAQCIYETDDDNSPNEHWGRRDENISGALIVNAGRRWVNVYRYFTGKNIWPRGLPLDEITSQQAALEPAKEVLSAPIQQGLINNSPDVDAIWRLVFGECFNYDAAVDGKTVYLKPGQWCPFNTQSTWWWPLAYPLLYVPSYCSFRMCDIWKSFVAQRCLWALNVGIAFHSPEAHQDRNEHSLMRDFEDEISGYLQNRRIAEILENTALESGEGSVCNNLRTCYESLVCEGIFPEEELTLVDLWLEDMHLDS